MFSKLEKRIESEFGVFLSSSAFKDDSTPESAFYVMFFEFVARNASLCRIILNSPHTGNSSFLTRAMESGRYKVTGMMTRRYPDCPASKIDFYYVFVSHGFLGLLEYWLNSGMRESIEDIARIGEQVSFMGIKFLEK